MRNILLLLTAFTACSLNAQSWRWAKGYASSDGVAGVGMEIMNDGGPMVTGFMADTTWFDTGTFTTPGYFSPFLARYSKNGTESWVKTPTLGKGWGFDLQKAPSGGLYTCGIFGDTLIWGGFTLTTSQSPHYGAYFGKIDENGDPIWLKKAEGYNVVAGARLATTPEGDLLCFGFMSDTADFGDTVLTGTPGKYHNFLVKYDAQGNFQWARMYRITSLFEFVCPDLIETDASGNIYLNTPFEDTAYVGTNMVVAYDNGKDDLLIKCDPSGNPIWYKAVTGPHESYIWDISMGANQEVLLTGYVSDSGNILGTVVNGAPNTGTMFLASVSPSGMVNWVKTVSSSEMILGFGVAADASGNILVLGGYKGNVNFEGTPFSSTDMGAFYTAKFSSGGALHWVVAGSGGCNMTYLNETMLDDESNLLTTGVYEDSLVLGGFDLTKAYTTNMVVAKFNTGIVGVEQERPAPEALNLYPNPAAGSFSVNGMEGSGEVTLYTLRGERVRTYAFAPGMTLQTEGLAEGVYVVTITQGGKRSVAGSLIVRANP